MRLLIGDPVHVLPAGSVIDVPHALGGPSPSLPAGLSSVVVNYKTPADLDAFLASYAAFAPTMRSTLTIVNVEPGPADMAVAWRWSRRLPGVRVLATEDNVGYARACNMGALDADGDVLAFFNADVILTARALDQCYAAITANPTWAVLGPRQVDAANRIVSAGVYGDPTSPAFGAWMAPDTGQCSEVRTDALTVSGSAYFVRRDAWDQLAGCAVFRASSPEAVGAFLVTAHFYEEEFLSGHAREHGWRVVFFGPVGIVHLWHRASPHGGPADQQMPVARAVYRAACDAHGIVHG